MAFVLLSRSRSKPQGSVKPAPKQKSARGLHSANSQFGFAQPVFQPQSAALPTAPSVPFSSNRGGILQRKCACAGSASMSGECEACSKKQRLSLQTKLKVTEPGDIYEQEADRIADQVLATPAHPAISGAPPRIQRFSGQSNGQIDTAPASVNQVLASPGRPLEPALRRDMEQRFGHDFSRVRVHSGGVAEQSARDVDAHAFTVGQDIVFGAGQFAPGMHKGRRLIAHELTHVVQQILLPGLSQPFQGQRPLPIQRDEAEGSPVEEPEAHPSQEEEAAERQSSEKLRDTIHGKYWSLQLRIAKAEALNRTPKRQEWLRRLEAESSGLERIQTKQGLVGMGDVLPLFDRLERLIKEVDSEHRLAVTLWEKAVNRYSAELIRLQDEGERESELAAKFLNQAFDEIDDKIANVIGTDTLVQDDFSPLLYILDNQTYLKSARIVEERERKEEEEELDRLSEVPEEGPGILETAWSIVGCDSALECFGDAALTVLTAGAGKAVKAVAKAAKAVRKVKKARKVIRSAEQLDKTLGKVLKAAKGVGKLVSIVKDSAVDAATTYGQWLKKDWKSVASRISTDLIGGHTTGAGQGAGTVAVARMNKDFIATVLEQQIGMSRPNPRLIKAAIGWVSTKRYKIAAARVRTFILQALKFRTAVNVSFESLRAGTPLTESNEIVRRTLVSTTAEVAQDTVQAIPVVTESGLARYLTEAIRKVVQGIFG